MEFDGCNSINYKALMKFNMIKDYLATLKIIGCVNISDWGMSLEHLQ